MVELADTAVLGTASTECRFESCQAHFKVLSFYTFLEVDYELFLFLLIIQMFGLKENFILLLIRNLHLILLRHMINLSKIIVGL